MKSSSVKDKLKRLFTLQAELPAEQRLSATLATVEASQAEVIDALVDLEKTLVLRNERRRPSFVGPLPQPQRQG